MGRKIPFAQYLFTRLGQLNCKSIHGVPGDFFLRALDYTRPSGVNWIGNANELCAGYAADGYARASTQLARNLRGRNTEKPSRVVGALLTTYGVGELSALNAVAGSYAESIPVVSLVATPSRRAMREGSAKRPVHHTLADGRTNVYAEMTKEVTAAQAVLSEYNSITDAAEAYDEVLESCISLSKPAYVSFSSDMVEEQISAELLERALKTAPAQNDPSVEEEIVEHLARQLRESKRPLIIADGLAYPLQLQAEINELASLTGIPAMSFTSGKGIINENLASWKPALPNTTHYSRNADLVLLFGPLLADTNTARWSAIPDVANTITFNVQNVEIAGKVYESIRSKQLLRALLNRLRESSLSQKASLDPSSKDGPPSGSSPGSGNQITQDDFWPEVSSFVQAEDTLLLANGTPLIGGRSIHLKPNIQVVASSVWCSIGHMLPAAQGIAAAKRDHNLPGRTILFEGDGSFQVTAQSISDIIRNKLDVTIIIINNAGYTYERWLHGMKDDYNDVPAWNYIDAPRFFGADVNSSRYPIHVAKVETWGELQDALADKKLHDGRGLKILDVVMAPEDVPVKSKPGLMRASEALRTA